MDKTKKLFEQITSALDEGVVVINKEGIIQTVNNAVTDLFGYSKNDLLDKNVKILMPDKYSRHHDEYIDNYNKTKKSKILDQGREVEGRKKMENYLV